jgi:uncharacterized protein involved in exopolysaccharide biosynthesis
MIGRRWRLIALVAVAAAAVALVLASLRPIEYEASATLVLSGSRSSPDDLAGRQATIRTLLASPNLIAEVLHGTRLAGSVSPSEFARDRLEIRDIPNMPALGLRVRAPDPSLAESLAKRLVDAAVAHGSRFDRDLAADQRDRLAKQTAAIGERLKGAEDRLLAYRQSSQIDVLRARVERLLVRRGMALGLPANLARDRAQTRMDDVVTTTLPKRPTTSLSEPDEIEQLNLLHTREMELARLETDYKVIQRVYRDLAGRYERSLAAEQVITRPVRLLESNIAPGVPLPRGRVRQAALALFAGLLVGVVIGLALEARKAHAARLQRT